MVYYKSLGSANGKFPPANRAAIVTDVREVSRSEAGVPVNFPPVEGQAIEQQARLQVINPTGVFFSDWLDQGQEAGQWDWMPFQKDQQARLAKEEAAKTN